MFSCSIAALPGMPVCVKIGRFVATCALPTARNTLRSSAVISSHEPISPNAPAGYSSACLMSARTICSSLIVANLFRVERLRVEARRPHDRQAGLHRRLPDELEVACPCPRAPASTMQPTPSRLRAGELLGHQVDVAHRVGARRGRRRTCGTLRRRRALRGEHRGSRRAEAIAEIRPERQVLVEQRGAARELLGGVVLEQRADHGAFRERGRLRRTP